MLSLHKKRRTIISAVTAAVMLLPVAFFAISKTAVSNNTYALSYSIPGGYTSIVDSNFYDCVMNEFITNKYDSDIDPSVDEIIATGLTDDQLARIERLTCDGSGKPDEALITDTTGIEKMSSLWYLDLGSNLLTSINLSGNPGMWYLDLNSNQLASINLSSGTTLDQAYLYSNQLTSVDISNNTKLTRLDVFDNQLTFIDISNNAAKLQTLKADDIYLYTGIVPVKSGSNYVYDLSGLKYIKDGGHGPDGNVDFTIENTSNYSYDDTNMILTISNLAGAGGYVPVNGSIENYSYMFKLATLLEFDANGGSGSFEMMNCYMGAEAANCRVTLPTAVPTRDNYYFLGWADSASATTAAYAAGEAISLSESKTIYAVWAPIYTLSYDSNGGSTAPEAESCHANDTTSGCNIVISSAVLTKEGFNFLGWANAANATAADYEIGGSITISSNKTIYAVWSQNTNTYTLSFDANNGSGAPNEVACTTTATSCSVEIPTTIPTRDGYTFLGWANSASATAGVYAAGVSVSLNASKTVYAIWAPNYTLTFNANNGSAAPAAQTCHPTTTNGSCSVNIPSSTPNRNGYNFLGYADSTDATIATYEAGSSVSLNASKTIYAVWEIVNTTLSLSFNLNGGDGTIGSVTCSVNVNNQTCTVRIPDGAPTRDGYYFLGWADSASATEPNDSYSAEAEVTLSGNKTLYAVWAPIRTLSYDSNGGGLAPGSDSCYANDAVSGCDLTVSMAELTRDGYYFLGWADSANATEAVYSAGNSISLSADKTLYAIWAPNYTLTFNANNGSAAPSAQTCHPNTTNGSCSVNIPSSTPNRNGYNFLGYADSASATAAAYSAGGSLTISTNKTIYAVWELVQNTLTLGFNLNGGEGTISNVTCNVDIEHVTCDAMIPEAELTREGYNFLGWADEETATEAAYVAGDSIALSADKTVYAVWQEADEEEEPVIPDDDSEEEEAELPVPNTGANMMGEGGAVLMFTLAPTIITASYLAIRYNKKVHFKND